ncbi:hypothetical protein J2X48_000717 [Bosea sp. BE271]|uniref:hypothetical protein n=1 Tax=Bosea TaxID=85413 RepID=UPI00285B0704|nr:MULTISPECIES: hypothetical protein [Bosea]MDR6826479.1 hypothetical protein [Bosea robiniae]MDR6893189.1 hypothetical protein [Bosea sp. BE109]MDR7137112.1 hypothetical protein [Bosea sp. BE168]MDR7173811.1 hypothetical protein [Bosea sp. BE271]
MASYNKFNQFTKDLIDGVHDFDAHTFKVMLTNTAPVNTNTVKANLTEISAGNGYTAGGTATTISTSTSSGTAKVTGTDVVFTAAGGSIGPLRYAVLYNDSPTSPADPLIGWWDYGSSITLADTETLTVDFDGTNGILTVA